jgi:hypothetical protein
LSPLTLVGAGLTWVGVLSLGPRKDIPEFWICLPAGLIRLLVIQGIVLGATIWLPRRTVVRFALGVEDLGLETKAHGTFVCPIRDFEKITETRCRKGRISGWQIRCPLQGWVFMDSQTPNSKNPSNKLTKFPSVSRG